MVLSMKGQDKIMKTGPHGMTITEYKNHLQNGGNNYNINRVFNQLKTPEGQFYAQSSSGSLTSTTTTSLSSSFGNSNCSSSGTVYHRGEPQ